MARSESQGLQVAVILFTMLTVGLAISTYMYYAASETAAKKLADAEDRAKKAQDQLLKQSYKVKVYEYIQGASEASEPEIANLKETTGGDATAEKALADYKKLMQGHEQAVTENMKGITKLPTYLSATIATKNKTISTARETEGSLNKEKTAIEQREQERAKTAEAAMQKAADDLAAERNSFNAERDAFKKKQDELVAQISEKEKQLKEAKEKADKDFAELTSTIGKLQRDHDIVLEKFKGIRQDGPDFESPDGEVTWVSQRQRIAYINLGSSDGLTRQITFSVYGRDENGVATGAEAKGRLEVIRLLEPHLAECRILEDEIRNPILPGDKVFTPAWSPGQQLHFALNGTLDVDGDGTADNDEVRAIITVNGGVVDAELRPDGKLVGAISAQTRYVVRGKPPTEREFGAKSGAQYNDMVKDAEKYGAEIVDVGRFMGLMGWKTQDRTLNLGGKRGASRREFRPRTPGSGAEAADSAADEKGAEDTMDAAAPADEKPADPKPAEEAPAEEDNPFES
jgi:hypothetical protein